jgi:NAD(P)-dependent dehydrogenase (short-subunit alcohol dehydrogenase family)
MLAHVLDLEVTSDVYYIKDENKSATNRSNMWSGRTIVYPGLCRCLRKWAMSTTAQDESVDRVWAAWRTGHQYEGGDVRHQKAALSAAARPPEAAFGQSNSYDVEGASRSLADTISRGHSMIRPEQRVSVVTGATGGIGRWIALGLAQADHHVVLVCRDAEKGHMLSAWIREHAPAASTELRLADLSSLRAARHLGEEIAAAHPRLAVLVNNAGMFTARRTTTVEGHDIVIAVNHLAPLVLTDALEGALRAGRRSRIVNVGSSTSDRARIDPDNLELVRHWGMVRAYGRSKLAMMMSTFVRAQRLRGSGVVANVVHPGMVATGLVRERGAIGFAWRLMGPFLRSGQQGADTPLQVALAADWEAVSGAYVKDRASVRPNRRALDPVLLDQVEAASRALAARSTVVDALP